MKSIDLGMACVDCVQFIEVPELDGFFYHYGDEEGQKRIDDISYEVDKLKKTEKLESLHIDTSFHDEFSKCRCDCCGSILAGERFGLVGLTC